MSRIGKVPIAVASNVKVEIKDGNVKVEGPKGKLSLAYRPEVAVEMKDAIIAVTRHGNDKKSRAMHGLYRKLIDNMVKGVSEGFKRTLIISGVGYRAEKKGNLIVFNLGYSNPIEYPIPEGITIDVESNTKLIVGSIDKEKLGKICAEIKKFRLPEPYKGKGIRFEEEKIRKKVGKTGVK